MADTKMLTDLADACRSSGLQVVEVEGWQTRSAAPKGGDYGGPGLDAVNSITVHGTAVAPSTKGDMPTLNWLIKGDQGVLSQVGLSRSGVVYVIAAGICWHSGKTEQPLLMANRVSLGVEAEHSNSPFEPWPLVQYQAYARLVAALTIWYDAIVYGHKETSLEGKVDPSFDMVDFREHVDLIGSLLSDFQDIEPVIDVDRVIKRGMRGVDVEAVQKSLRRFGSKIDVDGVFGPGTERVIKDFQQSNGLEPDGIVGARTAHVIRVRLAGLSPDPDLLGKSPSPVIPAPPKPPEESEWPPARTATAFGYGAEGRDVTRWQDNLVDLGYNISPDERGTFREGTHRATLEFQKDARLTEDGRVGARTTSHMEDLLADIEAEEERKKNLLSQGMEGAKVEAWQEALRSLGWPHKADGDFGPLTVDGTKDAQRVAGVEADGVVGPATRTAVAKLVNVGAAPLAPVPEVGEVIASFPDKNLSVEDPEFWRQLDEWVMSMGFQVYCGYYHQRVKKSCRPGNHGHHPKSIHFNAYYGKRGGALDVGYDPSSGASVSEYELAHVTALLQEIHRRRPELKAMTVFNRGSNDHRDHGHLQSEQTATPWDDIRWPATNIKLNSRVVAGLSGKPVRRGAVVKLRAKKGDRGTLVRQIQHRSRAYLEIDLDGVYGENTVRAVKLWQEALGVKADGKFGAATLRAEMQGRVLRRGDYLLAVKWVQLLLGQKMDGKFGPATEAALKDAQRVNGLTADGVWGDGCRARLIA